MGVFSPGTPYCKNPTRQGSRCQGLYPEGSSRRYALVNFGDRAGANEFGVQLGGGIEFRMSEKYSLTGKVRYNWINTEESLSVIDFSGGLKLHF